MIISFKAYRHCKGICHYKIRKCKCPIIILERA
nr:MAG TPA: hypothetical protein [Crassvirales sp.]